MQNRSLIIKNICPGLIERGKIKIGRKGAERTAQSGDKYQVPEKLDHFIVTGMSRDASNNFAPDTAIMAMLGPDPKEIPIRLIYDQIDLNFQCRYACYTGKACWCSGDGESANRLKKDRKPGDPVSDLVECPCERQNPAYPGKDRCKMNGVLACIIDGAETVGGVYKFRTTGYNSTVGILSSLTLIKSMSGGVLAGLPLKMTIQPKTVSSPLDGKTQIVYVVGVEFKGSVMALKDAGHKVLLEYKTHDIKMGQIESEARQLITAEFEQEDDNFAAPDVPQAPALSAPAVQPDPSAQAAPAAEQGPDPAAAAQVPPAGVRRGRRSKAEIAAAQANPPAPAGGQEAQKTAPAPDPVKTTPEPVKATTPPPAQAQHHPEDPAKTAEPASNAEFDIFS